MRQLNKRIKCGDGHSLSVQANSSAYCTPRDDSGTWTHYEVGFIYDANGNQVSPPDSWKEYADGEFPSDVYGYVPAELIVKFIVEHAG